MLRLDCLSKIQRSYKRLVQSFVLLVLQHELVRLKYHVQALRMYVVTVEDGVRPCCPLLGHNVRTQLSFSRRICDGALSRWNSKAAG